MLLCRTLWQKRRSERERERELQRWQRDGHERGKETESERERERDRETERQRHRERERNRHEKDGNWGNAVSWATPPIRPPLPPLSCHAYVAVCSEHTTHCLFVRTYPRRCNAWYRLLVILRILLACLLERILAKFGSRYTLNGSAEDSQARGHADRQVERLSDYDSDSLGLRRLLFKAAREWRLWLQRHLRFIHLFLALLEARFDIFNSNWDSSLTVRRLINLQSRLKALQSHKLVLLQIDLANITGQTVIKNTLFCWLILLCFDLMVAFLLSHDCLWLPYGSSISLLP